MRLKVNDYIYVIAQFAMFILFLFDWDYGEFLFPDWLNNMGMGLFVFGILVVLIAIIQLNTNISPFPSPKANSHVISNGVFKYIRHPIYCGIISGFIGISFYSGSIVKLLITAGLSILFYFKSIYEEKRLNLYLEEYETYKSKTKRFIPFIF